jgi:hypothetical protein
MNCQDFAEQLRAAAQDHHFFGTIPSIKLQKKPDKVRENHAREL